jgi:hypothetical protein
MREHYQLPLTVSLTLISTLCYTQTPSNITLLGHFAVNIDAAVLNTSYPITLKIVCTRLNMLLSSFT